MSNLMDQARRWFGNAMDASGLGPEEAPFSIVAQMPGARLRMYEPNALAGGLAMLIVSAPFKRPYIWDLLPEVSVVRRCLERGMRVYLLEWLEPTAEQDHLGLADYADRLTDLAVDAISATAGNAGLMVAGHSIGGTFAAIYASLHPERVAGLVLVDSPLAFAKHGGPIAQAVAAMPHARYIRATAGRPISGSTINLLSVAAVPQAFHWQRWADLAGSLGNRQAMRIHARVERWTMDEFPLPGQLFEDIVERLYRDDRFQQGTLSVGGKLTGVAQLRSPILAVINPVGYVVPPQSMLTALDRLPPSQRHVLRYEGDSGPAIQHLGPLVGRRAHERLWPAILDWARLLATAHKPAATSSAGI